MTGAARRNISIAVLCLRTMALVTHDMRVGARRNGHGYPAATGSMTSRTTHSAQARVTGMIESHVETLECRKRFECSRLTIRMTDCADRAGGIGKLLRVAPGAGKMTTAARHRWTRVGVLAAMT